MEAQSVKIETLNLDPANVRAHDSKNLDAIKASLQRFGQQKPIVVNSKNIVIAGNGTLTAARALGWQSINVVKTDLEGAEATAFAIADNRTAELAAWDSYALGQQLEAIKEEDKELVSAAGFTDEEIGQILESVGVFDTQESELPALPDGDRAPYQQKTFTFHDEQAEAVDLAIQIAKDMGHNQSPINENSNGNALAFICQSFIRANE